MRQLRRLTSSTRSPIFSQYSETLNGLNIIKSFGAEKRFIKEMDHKINENLIFIYSEIAVYDITGNKVSGKENLTLEKLNEWSGNIKWNCVGQPKGTYLIKIQHGNNTKTLKVVVN